MRTRNTDATKSATPKKSPPARKSATKTTPDHAADSATPKSSETKRSAAAKAKQAKNNEATPLPMVGSDSKPEQSAVEETKSSIDVTSVTPEAKVVPRKKTVVKKKVVKVVKKMPRKTETPTAAKVVSCQLSNVKESVKDKDEASAKEEVDNAKGFKLMNKGDSAADNVGEFMKKEESTSEVGETVVENVAESVDKGKAIMELEGPVIECAEENQSTTEIIGEPEMKEQIAMVVPSDEISEFSKNQEPSSAEKGEEATGVETRDFVDKEENKIKAVETEEKITNELQVKDTQPVQDEYAGDEGYEEYGDQVDFEDHGDDDFVEEDPEEPVEDNPEALEEEHKELTAVAKERKIKKEYEIFVGGLDREATEEDVRRVFEKIGEVVEVRLHRNLSMNKSKGYAFVKFANKEHAKRALSEMKNPVICGKRCGTAPSEDNDTLFLGNICNTWTKEAIRQKLKDYRVEGVENITLVPDVHHEGRSRGFAFLEFSCHADAMHAYKRLQKPDVVFGHPERTAKVAFAEPIREPDPEIMAHVKTVFLDGLPPHWDEDLVRKHLQGYGEIVRIVLARNMSTAKRKDFGFVDFSSHEAAIACIEKINNIELGDGNSKTRVKARLSNPMPKTQAVKGGMSGGFLIDRTGNETSSRFGRSFGRGGHHVNWTNFQRDRGFYQRGRGQSSRVGPNEYDFNNRYGVIHGRQIIGRGGRRGPLRGGYYRAGRGVGDGPSRANFNRPWFDAPERGHGDHASSRRQPFSPEEAFDRPYIGRHYDDPYFYDDGAHGMKRPLYAADHDPDYAEPSRVRPRLDYTDPTVPFRGTHYRDTYEAGRDPYSHGYYGPEYGAFSPYYRNDRPYGGGYYY